MWALASLWETPMEHLELVLGWLSLSLAAACRVSSSAGGRALSLSLFLPPSLTATPYCIVLDKIYFRVIKMYIYANIRDLLLLLMNE